MITKDDKWIMDLSTSHEDHIKRLNIFSEYLKKKEPVWFIDHKRPNEKYLSIFTWKDTVSISLDSDTFYSEEGYMINDNFKNMPFDGSLLSMNGDRHKMVRGIISSVFTRSKIESLEDIIREVTEKAFETFIQKNGKSGDIYTDLCMKIPLEINRIMMGVDISDSDYIMELTKYIVGNDDPDSGNGDPMSWLRACKKLKNYSSKLAEEKTIRRSDDLTSMLVHATNQREALTQYEFAQFFILLVVAGMETTTHTLGHGLKLLHLNIDEKNKLRDDFDKHIETACEEILRLEPAVLHFRRTAVANSSINGFDLNQGDKIVMWYYTANRDPEKFVNPNAFKVDRPKVPTHTSFGGPGIHHCLGAQLARMEMRIFYEYMFKYMPNFTIDINKVKYVKSRWGNGLKSLPGSW